MALSNLDGNVLDQAGRAVSGALVYVYDLDGNLAALSDELGASVSNPVTAGEDGYWSAWVAEEGFYTIKYNWAGRERLIEANRVAGRTPLAQANASAAAAEAASGPTYASTAAGLAATTDGQGFAVDNGDGTVTVWLNDGGSAVEQRRLATAAALASTDADKGASLIKLTNGANVERSFAQVRSPFDLTVQVDGSSGNDASGDILTTSPFATPQAAIDALPTLSDGKTVRVQIQNGDYSNNPRADMQRRAVLAIDRLWTGQRTDNQGDPVTGGMRGGLVIEFASGAKIIPNGTNPRGIYHTGNTGSVAFVDVNIEAAAGAESCFVAHRGSYSHVRRGKFNGNSIASRGLYVEGGNCEMIDVEMTGSTTDVSVVPSGIAQFAGPNDGALIGSINNNGTLFMGSNVRVTGRFTHTAGTIISTAGAATKTLLGGGTYSGPLRIEGDFFGYGGTLFGPWVRFEKSTGVVWFDQMMLNGDIWKSDAQLNLINSTFEGNGFESWIATANTSPHARPIRLFGNSHFLGRYRTDTGTYGTNSIKDNAGAAFDPTRNGKAIAYASGAASGQVVPVQWDGGRASTVLLQNNSGGTLNNFTLPLTYEAGTRYAGETIRDGHELTLVTNATNSIIFIPGASIVTLPLGSMTLGTAAAACRMIKFRYFAVLGKWMLTDWIMNIQTAPITTYVAPAGGATVDAEARASLAQLAADVANLRTKTQTYRVHS